MSEPALLRADRAKGVATLLLNRPARRNAMDCEMIDDLSHALKALDSDERISAIVLAGAEHGFCAGSDLKYIGALSHGDMCRFEQDCGDMARLIGQISKPVIAAVERFAIGGGLILAASCDFVVANRSARLSLPEVPLGWLTPWGLEALSMRVGLVQARGLCFNLQDIPVDDAHAIGLIDFVSADGEALDEAMRIAGQLADLPREAVAATKEYFSRRIMREAETADVEANRLFAMNVRSARARTSLGHSRAAILGLEL